MEQVFTVPTNTLDSYARTAEGGFLMNGSGCKNCPVRPCETINYRGSTCAAQRAKYGLSDPMTNGVTVQEWIPVKDRLPDDSIPSTFYLCYWNGYIRVCKYWRARKVFELRGKTVKVTHWMPLPEPPMALAIQ